MRWLVLLLCGLLLSGQHGDRKVLGQLAQTTAEANIYARPKVDVNILHTVQKNEYLAVSDSEVRGWLRVRLEDGSQGYIEAKLVEKLPYLVTETGTIPMKDPRAERIVQRATQAIGTPLKTGGKDLSKAIGPVEFIATVCGAEGLKLPADLPGQMKVGSEVSRLEDLDPGDRLYFRTSQSEKPAIGGIFVGSGQFIAAWPGGAVRKLSLKSKPYSFLLLSARHD